MKGRGAKKKRFTKAGHPQYMVDPHNIEVKNCGLIGLVCLGADDPEFMHSCPQGAGMQTKDQGGE